MLDWKNESGRKKQYFKRRFSSLSKETGWNTYKQPQRIPQTINSTSLRLCHFQTVAETFKKLLKAFSESETPEPRKNKVKVSIEPRKYDSMSDLKIPYDKNHAKSRASDKTIK